MLTGVGGVIDLGSSPEKQRDGALLIQKPVPVCVSRKSVCHWVWFVNEGKCMLVSGRVCGRGAVPWPAGNLPISGDECVWSGDMPPPTIPLGDDPKGKACLSPGGSSAVAGPLEARSMTSIKGSLISEFTEGTVTSRATVPAVSHSPHPPTPSTKGAFVAPGWTCASAALLGRCSGGPGGLCKNGGACARKRKPTQFLKGDVTKCHRPTYLGRWTETQPSRPLGKVCTSCHIHVENRPFMQDTGPRGRGTSDALCQGGQVSVFTACVQGFAGGRRGGVQGLSPGGSAPRLRPPGWCAHRDLGSVGDRGTGRTSDGLGVAGLALPEVRGWSQFRPPKGPRSGLHPTPAS
ncbi:hypothetical protein HJG60_011661 [Phyllostomus discolor]|uniref:Uncharacterized protein n=1 Tax=Phyllostomus discolor TaxID=89673 RepID=A0A833ZU32_9CHIR|nr:hypothetical protein HJG60_011661 [Phyllostomus discolor]